MVQHHVRKHSRPVFTLCYQSILERVVSGTRHLPPGHDTSVTDISSWNLFVPCAASCSSSRSCFGICLSCWNCVNVYICGLVVQMVSLLYLCAWNCGGQEQKKNIQRCTVHENIIQHPWTGVWNRGTTQQEVLVSLQPRTWTPADRFY